MTGQQKSAPHGDRVEWSSVCWRRRWPFCWHPIAAAQPDADANAAITAAWEASGGDGGTLGPKDGDVYPAGQGFGQNFAGGKIFFTPDTGAHIMQGAILEKYESLGGPADSDLGFPTIDEGPGRAPGQPQHHVQRGGQPGDLLDARHRRPRRARRRSTPRGTSSAGRRVSSACPPRTRPTAATSSPRSSPAASCRTTPRTKKFTTVPPELAAQLSGLEFPDDADRGDQCGPARRRGSPGPAGGCQGPAVSDRQRRRSGRTSRAARSSTAPATGANVVTGQVLAKYESVGGPQGDLGFPTVQRGRRRARDRQSDERRFAAEDKPVIFWTPDYGAVDRARRDERGLGPAGRREGTTGRADGRPDRGRRRHHAASSAAAWSRWDRSNNTFTTEPPNLAVRVVRTASARAERARGAERRAIVEIPTATSGSN